MLIRLRQEIEAFTLELAHTNQRLQAELAITLLEPNLLAWANIRRFFHESVCAIHRAYVNIQHLLYLGRNEHVLGFL